MSRRLKLAIWSLLALPLAGFTALAVRDPDGFSRTFLRTGGRFVLLATGKPRLVAALLAAAVVAVWIVIAAACLVESRRSTGSADKH